MPRSAAPKASLTIALVLSSFLAIKSAQAQEPPVSGEEVINKYIESTGGRDAYAKVKSRVVTGTVAVPAQNITGKVSVWQKAPGLLLEVVEIPGVGTERRGYNSTTDVGWSSSDMSGVRLVKGDELDRLRQEADAQGELNWKKLYTEAKVAGSERVGAAECYKVEMTTKSGKTETRFYSKSTGLLTRTVAEIELPQGKIGADATISDYRNVDGLKIAFNNSSKLSVSGMQLVQNIVIDKIETNVEIPDDKFALPDDVQKLVEKEKTAGGATGGGEK